MNWIDLLDNTYIQLAMIVTFTAIMFLLMEKFGPKGRELTTIKGKVIRIDYVPLQTGIIANYGDYYKITIKTDDGDTYTKSNPEPIEIGSNFSFYKFEEEK